MLQRKVGFLSITKQFQTINPCVYFHQFSNYLSKHANLSFYKCFYKVYTTQISVDKKMYLLNNFLQTWS